MEASRNRDEFPAYVKRYLAMRVAYRCSRPGCPRVTVGPSLSGTDVVILGEAAHITAAAPRGPRYDPSLSAAERSAHENGIWLCRECAALIDRDIDQFQAETLRKWKQAAEIRAYRQMDSVTRPDQLTVDRFKAAWELAASRESLAVFHALFDADNPYADRNREISELGVSLITDPRASQVCHMSLRAAVNDLLADLALFAETGSGAYRFADSQTNRNKRVS